MNGIWFHRFHLLPLDSLPQTLCHRGINYYKCCCASVYLEGISTYPPSLFQLRKNYFPPRPRQRKSRTWNRRRTAPTQRSQQKHVSSTDEEENEDGDEAELESDQV